MRVDPSQYTEIPANEHGISAGTILLPTPEPIVAGGGSSLDFVLNQGGDRDTFIFMFGVRTMQNLLGMRMEVLEGVFLSETGPGFHPTWDFHQLMRETGLGGWTVVPTEEVLGDGEWVAKVEARINL